MNKNLHNLMMALFLVLVMFILGACGTVQVERVEPDLAVGELQAAVEEPTLVDVATVTDIGETAVSPTSTAALMLANTPTPTPALMNAIPLSEGVPTVHSSGSGELVALPACFDFDNGVSLAPPDPNCDFNLLPGPDTESIEIYPIAPAELAYGSVFAEPPTFAQCNSNDAFSADSVLVSLPDAQMSIICYRTGENRVGYLHLTFNADQSYTVELEWLTFADGETNLVYQHDTFGFKLPLPETWEGFEVTQNDDDGNSSLCFTFIGSPPFCVLQIDVYTHAAWNSRENVPEGYYLAENEQFVFAAGPHQEECVQLDAFQCERYHEIPMILTRFVLE